MDAWTVARGSVALGLLGAALGGVASCTDASVKPGPTTSPWRATAVESPTHVEVAFAESSMPLRLIASEPDAEGEREGEEEEHEPVRNARSVQRVVPVDDPVMQSHHPVSTMPATFRNFLGQGNTISPGTMSGTPPDTNGAVGPNHYVQVVNGGVAIWNKQGTIVSASAKIGGLWTGYVGTNPGNSCGTRNDGDPVVLYDQLADRWFITQFSLPAGATNYQCVAVSKTPDPTGAYWLYDYPYSGLNDYGKFGLWPDAYYATFNIYAGGGADADVCAYDRSSMLRGMPAAQHCFQQRGGIFGLLPVSLDGPVKPPRGEPGFFASLGNQTSDSIDLWKMHVDWQTPSNTTLTGPTTLSVAPFAPLCNGGSCVPQPSPGNHLASLADRPMFRFAYRNFGTHESLLLNHSVTANGTGGVRWYEIRSPSTTPTIFQQGTYAPNDGNWRWMGSIAQDQAQGMALGFTISSATQFPSMAWTGRLASDMPGVMGQGETVVDDGSGVETGNFGNGQAAQRWGDYSNMTVDPTDDCTFWYTSELYHATGPSPKTWDTQIAAVKYPNCAANDFTIAITPAAKKVGLGASTTYAVATTSAVGSPESLALNIQDLPTGVTATFNPATVTAGATSMLTLAAAANAPLTGNGPSTFTVIATATSAVHPAYASVEVVTCAPLTACPAPDDCGVLPDGCGGTVSCGMCPSGQTCSANKCSGGDGGGVGDGGHVGLDAGDDGSPSAGDTPPGGDSGGCGCRAAATRETSSAVLGMGVAILALVRRRRRGRGR